MSGICCSKFTAVGTKGTDEEGGSEEVEDGEEEVA